MQALLDPFNFRTSGNEVCIPDLKMAPSYKFSTTTRGVLQLGTQGIGGIIINPNVYSNNDDFLCYTNSLFTGTTLPSAVTYPTGVVGVSDAQFPWAGVPGGSNTLNPSQIRLVACGLRVRYKGTQLSMGGSMVPVSFPSFNNLGGASLPQLLLDTRVKTEPTNRSWQGCFFRPNQSIDYDYTTFNHNSTPGAYLDLGSCMAVYVDGVAANPYEFEVVRFFEAVPAAPTSTIASSDTFSWPYKLTKSDSDISGLSRVNDLLGGLSTSVVGQRVWSMVKQAAIAAVPHVAEAVVPGAGALLRGAAPLAIEWHSGL